MENAKPTCTPPANHFKLSKSSCPTSTKDIEEMKAVPFLFAVGNVIYAMVCTRPDTAHAIRVLSMFLSNLGKEYLGSC